MSPIEAVPDAALAAPGRNGQAGIAESGRGRIEIGGCPLDAATLDVLFPEFRADGPLIGLAAWRGARAHDRLRARAARSGLPFMSLGCGLLRAPPRSRGRSPLLSVTAIAALGRSSAADLVPRARFVDPRMGDAGADRARRCRAP